MKEQSFQKNRQIIKLGHGWGVVVRCTLQGES
jgi:hypothetical protein